MKLGEALVRDGIITREHLKLALERQVVFGGRIGTNVVELGILTEDELAKILSRYLNIPTATPLQLSGIDEETISCISKELAEKYKIIPFKKERNRLHVAMMEPRDVNTLDEIRFISGYDIIPYVASELRILYALEKYYGIKRDLRYISVFGQLEQEEKPALPQAAPKPAPPVTPPPSPLPAEPPAPPIREIPAPVAETEETAPVKPPAPPAAATPAPEIPQESEAEKLKKIKEAFADVKDRDEIAGLLVTEARKVAKRVAVFMVRGDRIIGWKSSGLDAEGLTIDITKSSMFSGVIQKKTYNRGPVLDVPANEEIIKMLSGTPQDSLSITLNIREKAVALLYADNGLTSVLEANISYINTLIAMSSIAFEILILRKKIMDL